MFAVAGENDDTHGRKRAAVKQTTARNVQSSVTNPLRTRRLCPLKQTWHISARPGRPIRYAACTVKLCENAKLTHPWLADKFQVVNHAKNEAHVWSLRRRKWSSRWRSACHVTIQLTNTGLSLMKEQRTLHATQWQRGPGCWVCQHTRSSAGEDEEVKKNDATRYTKQHN